METPKTIKYISYFFGLIGVAMLFAGAIETAGFFILAYIIFSDWGWENIYTFRDQVSPE